MSGHRELLSSIFAVETQQVTGEVSVLKKARVTRFAWWLMTKTPLVQSAERGACPEVMCATEDGLEQRALHGPTGWMQTGGPVGTGKLEPHAHDKPVMARLWDVSEQATGFTWPA